MISSVIQIGKATGNDQAELKLVQLIPENNDIKFLGQDWPKNTKPACIHSNEKEPAKLSKIQ